jgi:DNA-directed RNA polymerase specialized sigma24 family protein
MTERDRQILEMLSERLTVGEIAARLGVPRSTAASIALRAIEEYGDPGLAKLDEHIDALRRLRVAA